jgi:hypothetical protein
MLRIIGVRLHYSGIIFFLSNILLDKSKISGLAIGECLTFRHYKASVSIQPNSCSDKKHFVFCQDEKGSRKLLKNKIYYTFISAINNNQDFYV